MLHLRSEKKPLKGFPRSSSVVLLVCTALVFQLGSQSAVAGEGFDPGKNRGERMAYEALGGVTGVAAGGLGGLLLGVAAASTNTNNREGGFGIGAAIGAIALVGAGLLEPVGVYLAGRWSGANGSYWATLGGDVVGIGAGVGLGLSTLLIPKEYRKIPSYILIPIALAMPLAGSIAGYELTTSYRAGTQTATKQAFAQPRPIVSWAFVF
jgi:hypothetical protein